MESIFIAERVSLFFIYLLKGVLQYSETFVLIITVKGRLSALSAYLKTKVSGERLFELAAQSDQGVYQKNEKENEKEKLSGKEIYHRSHEILSKIDFRNPPFPFFKLAPSFNWTLIRNRVLIRNICPKTGSL